ncbi:MarR family transcriptional regulator [Bradyrhizobium sp. Tv2a-2]|uniref:MarR family winged helix-turn-helix transcriptional regulator n=1 Tax=Bradyrhizobium sp. Tv2a-2 TaxID=113395 RepID=UPI000684BF55|nr:MarR family transcriptional regulator [Bradyrhizobium sp. Tv2a-2]
MAPQPAEKAAKRPRPARTTGTDKTGRRGARVAPPQPEPALASVSPPPPGEGKRGESGYLGYLLRQAQAASRLTLERALGELGVTVPQFVALTMLKAYPGLSGAELARVALLTPQTVGVIIGNLERDGAIMKTPDPVHGRRLQWTLTPRGLTLLEQCRKRAMVLERRLVESLTPKDERVIRQWLARIAVSLQQDS